MLKAIMQQSLLEYEESQKSNEKDNMEFDLKMEKILSKMENVGARLVNVVELILIMSHHISFFLTNFPSMQDHLCFPNLISL